MAQEQVLEHEVVGWAYPRQDGREEYQRGAVKLTLECYRRGVDGHRSGYGTFRCSSGESEANHLSPGRVPFHQ
jgi:hypothetical protein